MDGPYTELHLEHLKSFHLVTFVPIMEANTITAKFKACLEKDRSYVKDWMITWEYQQKKRKRNIIHEENLVESFWAFNGGEDLIKWMNWFEVDFPGYFPDSMLKELIDQSYLNDKKVLESLYLEVNHVNYDKRIGLHNAEDFLFPQLYPVPERYKPKVVLDFGAGYGRQANLWTAKNDKVYIGMDAIPLSYSLQNLYYKGLGGNVTEYVDAPESFKLDMNNPGIYHLPTWRYDLLPDESLDLIMCVQVLPERNSKTAANMLRIFHKKLKPGGMLYIRDHGNAWKPAGKIDVDKFLSRNKFSLEFYPHTIDRSDMHGLVRIWRKDDPQVISTRISDLKEKKRQFIEDLDTALSGGLTKIKRRIKK